jgi:hypothetical protein
MIADCFSVDPGISDNVPAKPPAPVARAAAPPPPSHPSADVVDLAPAAPGYPPIHASHPAMDGCWWVPFLSHNFGFEAAIQTCGKKETTTLVFENEKGIVIKYQGNAAIEPEQICVVETKPAEQTIEAAIKQKHIMTLSVPAARSSCRAKCDPVNSAGTLNCNVEAVGPYSKLKKFNTEDDRGESPCPGLTTDDAIARFFLYRPSESKTKYLFFQEDDNGIVFDHESLHFATTP